MKTVLHLLVIPGAAGMQKAVVAGSAMSGWQ
jgi:hypothetical protein